jgi:hypothetical protein
MVWLAQGTLKRLKGISIEGMVFSLVQTDIAFYLNISGSPKDTQFVTHQLTEVDLLLQQPCVDGRELISWWPGHIQSLKSKNTQWGFLYRALKLGQ